MSKTYIGFTYETTGGNDIKDKIRMLARKRCIQGLDDSDLTINGIGLKTKNKKLYWPTYLAYLLDSKKSAIENEIESKQLVNQYEAFLTQCCYLSRLAYCNSAIFCRMTKFLDYPPNAFNDILEIIEDVFENDNPKYNFGYKIGFNSEQLLKNSKYKALFGEENVDIANAPEIKGGFFQNGKSLGAYIFLHNSKITNKNTLFVSFKGASDPKMFADILKKLTKVQLPQGDFPDNANRPYRVGDVYQTLLTRDDSLNQMITMIGNLAVNADCIVVTGHSLGGALASLFGFYLKYSTKSSIKAKPIHIITFGEPKAFYDISRQLFNSKLFNSPANKKSSLVGGGNNNTAAPNTRNSSAVFTYDAVINSNVGLSTRGDLFVKLPPNLKHPGYDLLFDPRKDMKAFTNTGRTNEIGEIRQMMGFTEKNEIENRYNTGNDILGIFEKVFPYDSVNSVKYKEALKTGSSDIKVKKTQVLKIALPDIKDESLYPSGKVLKAIASARGEMGGGISAELERAEKEAEDEYDEKTLITIPNVIKYDCYAKWCTAIYMGVNYYNVLRLPKSNPTNNFELVEVGGKIYSRCMGQCPAITNTNTRNNRPNTGNMKQNTVSTNSRRTNNVVPNSGNKRTNNQPKKKSLFTRMDEGIGKGWSKMTSGLRSASMQTGIGTESSVSGTSKKGFCSIL